MHTFKPDDTRIHHDNYEGKVKIVQISTGSEVIIPFNDLLEFVGGYVRKMKIAELERMDATEILGLGE